MLAVCKQVGLNQDAWQKDVFRVVLAKQADGSWAADTVGISIPRQTGKTYLVSSMVFALCLITPGLTVAWTAHHNKVMLETFRSLKSVAGKPRVMRHVSAVHASAEDRSIVFSNKSRIVMAARESGALRGVAKVDVLILDEAQIMTEDAMSDMMPTQNQSGQAGGSLTIMMGTPPRPKDPGEVFTRIRDEAISAEKHHRSPDLLAWIEFSADPSADTDDREQLRKANPSYPRRTPERAIGKMRKNLSEDNFRREALGIWDSNSTPQVIPAEVWDSLADDESTGVDQLVLAVDVSPARDMASVAVAALRDDGLIHVELVARQPGVGWLVQWLKDRQESNQLAAIVIDAKSPAASLLGDFKAAHLRVTVTGTDEMCAACAGFYDAAMQGRIRHIAQPQLTAALSMARKRPVGDRWAWNRKSNDSDITPIVAATLAVWGVESKARRAQRATRRRVMIG